MIKGVVNNTSISQEQAEILEMYTTDRETVRRIAIRRGTSTQAVYKTIKKLKQKGLINKGLQKTTTTRPLNPPKKLKKGIRLHGLEFNARLLYSSRFYDDYQRRVNLIYVNDCPVRLYKGAIEVYSGKGVSFVGEDEQRAFSLAMEFFDRLFRRLEHRLKVILIKEDGTRVRLVNAHYARLESGVAKEVKGGKVKIYAREDGKLWFLIDKSWSIDEDETVHPVTSKEDRRRVCKQLNDWRRNDPPTLSEISRLVFQNADNMAYFAENIKTHIKAIETLSAAVRDLKRVVRR